MSSLDLGSTAATAVEAVAGDAWWLSSASSSSMLSARDDVYCHNTARRAVATAAYRLGLPGMTQEALDSLAGVLLAYLERLGQTLAQLVEASGRSSAHCHVRDVLQAVQLCTSPAVQRVHLGNAIDGNEEDDNEDDNDNNMQSAMLDQNGGFNSNNNRQQNRPLQSPAEQMSWKGLAYFCFGPRWRDELPSPPKDKKDDSENNNKNSTRSSNDSNNGKGASAAASSQKHLFLPNLRFRGGWHAPFPEEVPYFPTVRDDGTSQTANPVHPAVSLYGTPSSSSWTEPSSKSSTKNSDTNKNSAAKSSNKALKAGAKNSNTPKKGTVENGEITEKSGASFADALLSPLFRPASVPWGSLNDADAKKNKKRSRPSETTSSSQPPNKKIKSEDNSQRRNDNDGDNDDDDETDYRDYLPRHFPPFPRASDAIRTLVREQQPQPLDEDSKPKAFPSSSGDGYNNNTTNQSSDPTISVRSALVQLGGGDPWGSVARRERNAGTISSNASGVVFGAVAAGHSEPPAQPPSIVPLNRASGSRVSRILEGSMDPYQAT